MQQPLGDDALPDLPQRETLSAVFSSTTRHGEWLPPEELRVIASFGSAKLDLTRALLAPGVTEFNVTALFGSVERRGGGGIVAGFLRDQVRRVMGSEPVPYEVEDDPPLLRITGHAIFGSITVRVR